MLAAIFLDPRLALVLLSVLVLAAGIPLAIAWVKLLPEEKPSFDRHGSPETERPTGSDFASSWKAGRDPFAATLLVFVTVSFLCEIPGVPRDFLVSRAAAFVPEPWLHGLLLFCRGFFIAIPAIAAVYSAFRPHAIRIPLIFAGVLVPVLWLTAPWLRAALLSP